MQSVELNTVKRRYRAKRYQSSKRSANLYFFAVLVLFSALVLMCVNNISVYNSYMEIKANYDSLSKSIQDIISEKELTNSDRDRLIEDNESLAAANKELKEKYEILAKQNLEIQEQLKLLKDENNALAIKNRELTEDNIELQNTLKMAAAAGIKPQNYTTFDGLSSRGSIDRGSYIGEFLGTAYTPSVEECGNDKGITNSGEPIIPGISIAIDKQYWPFGTIFYIKGLGYAVAMDTGSAIKGKYRFDFAVFDKKFAETLGSRKWDVYLVKLGNGTVEQTVF